MILLRLRYRPVTISLPSRYRYNVTLTDRRPPLHTVTDCYGPFPIVTERYMRYKRYILYLTKNFKWTVLKLIYYLSINLSLIKNLSSYMNVLCLFYSQYKIAIALSFKTKKILHLKLNMNATIIKKEII